MVPVVATNLEGSLPRIRTAIIAGTAIPRAMFLLWGAVILGALPAASPSPSLDVDQVVDPLVRLQAMGSGVGVRHSLAHATPGSVAYGSRMCSLALLLSYTLACSRLLAFLASSFSHPLKHAPIHSLYSC